MIIKLNVGGIIYCTDELTLKKYNSFLSKITNIDNKMEKDNEGNIFIDRDGITFSHILNYLRDETYIEILTKLNLTDRSKIILEARYFCLFNLVKILSKQTLFPIVTDILNNSYGLAKIKPIFNLLKYNGLNFNGITIEMLKNIYEIFETYGSANYFLVIKRGSSFDLHIEIYHVSELNCDIFDISYNKDTIKNLYQKCNTSGNYISLEFSTEIQNEDSEKINLHGYYLGNLYLQLLSGKLIFKCENENINIWDKYSSLNIVDYALLTFKNNINNAISILNK